MNYLVKLALYFFIICVSLSCEKTPPILSLNNSRTITFSQQGGSQSISFTTNRSWSISSGDTWCRVSPSSGNGLDDSVAVTLICEANTTFDSRVTTLTINAESLSETITISQDPNLAILVSPLSVNLSNEAQAIEFDISANVKYSVEIDAECKEWITQIGSKSLSAGKVSLSVSANDSFDMREGKVMIKQIDGPLSETIIIKQEQTNAIIITDKEYSLSCKQQSLEVTVQTNMMIEVDPKVDWIHFVQTKALSNNDIILSIDANETYHNRSGEVIIKGNDEKIKESFIITQNGLIKKEVVLQQAGTLKSQLGESYREINHLIVHGKLNGSDIRTIRDIDALKILDISDTDIVSSGDTYFDTYKTENNVIGTYMFFEKAYEQLFLPNSIVKIDARAFYKYYGRDFEIPNSVIEIGDYAFSESTTLTSIRIPNSVKVLGEYVFNNCSNIIKVVYGKGLSNTGRGTFSGCSSLREIELPETILTIGYECFYRCYSLEYVSLPTKLQIIDVDSFRCCSSLKEIVVPNSVTRIEENAFNCYDVTSSLTRIKLGANLEYIGNGCFYRAGRIKEIEIPAKVSYMGHDCFGYCGQLSIIRMKPLAPPQVTDFGNGRIHFYGLAPDAKIYVPNESLSAYKEAEHWRSLSSIVIGY